MIVAVEGLSAAGVPVSPASRFELAQMMLPGHSPTEREHRTGLQPILPRQATDHLSIGARCRGSAFMIFSDVGASVTTPAAGWYPDPSGAAGQRYFDGANWTDLRAEAQVRRRTRWPWVVAGVALLLLGGCGTFVVAHRDSIASIISGRQGDIGVPIDDGSLRFVVNSFGKAEMQGDPPPKGVYDILAVTVTNVGTKSQSFAAANQKVLDALGQAHVAMGLEVVGSKQDAKATEVNPGQALLVAVRFDVPAEPRIAAIELHESATSAGANARLH